MSLQDQKGSDNSDSEEEKERQRANSNPLQNANELNVQGERKASPQ